MLTYSRRLKPCGLNSEHAGGVMKLVIENANNFKKSIDAIAALIDEAEFIVNEKGLTLKATDPSQIAMIDFELPKEAFKEFDVSGEVTIGIDMDYLRQVISRAKSNDTLILGLGSEATALNITFKGKSQRSFSIPLIDVSKGQIPNPKIEFEANIRMRAGLLQDALKDAELISGHVVFGVTNDCFYVNANSSKGTLRNETKKDEAAILDFDVKKECKAMFPLDYLKDMLKTPSGEDEITLHLRTDAPVKIDFNIDKARVTYYLAPRIEAE